MSKSYDDTNYHFYIPDSIYYNFATALFKKHKFIWWNSDYINGKYHFTAYPFYFVVRGDTTIDWNRAVHKKLYPIIPINEWSDRYSRQILFREIGKEGQERLLNSRVLLVGASREFVLH